MWVALLLRWGVGCAQASDASAASADVAASPHVARWLWRHRAAGPLPLALAVFALAVMTVGVFATAAFNLRAVLLCRKRSGIPSFA